MMRVLDLFCGGGGSSWGARKAGAAIACAVDAWPIATQTYQTNFPGAQVINAKLDERTCPSLVAGAGRIDLLLASPECTNHTCAKGGRPRDESSRRTANYVVSFAEALTPRWVVLENVVQMRSWHGYTPLIDDLKRLGYKVEAHILDAADFGVPQTRRRLFLLCDREGAPGEIAIPERKRRRAIAADIVQFDGPWESRPLYSERRAPDTLARAERAMKELGKGQPFLIVYYGSDGSGGWQPLDRPLRTLTTLDRFGLVTWRGKTPMLRMLQVPELVRAMGFDKSYDLTHGSRRDRIKILGNGVCPPVMEAVVRSLIGSSHKRGRNPATTKRRTNRRQVFVTVD
jgi:DNA (cytosine-5)-methyltransferase 1